MRLRHPPTTAAPPCAHHTPDEWRDLVRDWQRWSGGERLAAECALAGLLLLATALLPLLRLP